MKKQETLQKIQEVYPEVTAEYIEAHAEEIIARKHVDKGGSQAGQDNFKASGVIKNNMTELPKNIDSEIALLEKQKIADGEAHVDFTCRGCAGFEGCREDDMRHHLEKDYEVCENWRPRQ